MEEFSRLRDQWATHVAKLITAYNYEGFLLGSPQHLAKMTATRSVRFFTRGQDLKECIVDCLKTCNSPNGAVHFCKLGCASSLCANLSTQEKVQSCADSSSFEGGFIEETNPCTSSIVRSQHSASNTVGAATSSTITKLIAATKKKRLA
ncbi:hypothetical protein WN944_022138 [Citrus x changshan-huyou]|uniref:Uncharacterized protein n=1 Tax=Citrus x changshan-huyou TaxID=2935761 RepID=A0AAP0N3Y5_9ROSI